MTQSETFVFYRKKIYASINGTKGNMSNLVKSRFLSKVEKELMNKVIDDLSNLSDYFYKNRGCINKVKEEHPLNNTK